MRLILTGLILLAALSKSFCQTESTDNIFVTVDSANNQIDTCSEAECYTCDEQESLAQYITELEVLNLTFALETVPQLRTKIGILEKETVRLLGIKNKQAKQMRLLEKNERSFKDIEFEYLSEIAKINTNNTELIIKNSNNKKAIWIVSGISAAVIGGLVIGFVLKK